jgi:iron-sulfur cluster assembly protein
MLTMTSNAAQTIKDLLASSGLPPDSAGLRIAVAEPAPDRDPGLAVSLTPVPGNDDQVVEQEGAQVFIEPAAADALDDKVLDATPEAGQARFTLAEQ